MGIIMTILDTAQKTKDMAEFAGRHVCITAETILPEPLSGLLTRLRQMSYMQWFLLGMGGLMFVITAPPVMIFTGVSTALAVPVLSFTSPIWLPFVLFLLFVTFPLWGSVLGILAIFRNVGRVKDKLLSALTDVQEVSPQPIKGLLRWYRSLSYTGEAMVVMGIVTAALLGVGAVLLVGTPTVVVGGGLLLLFSPLLLLTSPLWIPVVLFFLTMAGVVLGGGALAVAMAVVGYWVYRYNKGPMPLGGGMVLKLQERMKNTMQKTKEVAMEKGPQMLEEAKAKAEKVTG
ncbi:hypothetical protein CBR_g49358 [Chara braunii]|uniref:Oleosin n=1 Tax=Chara braunii TaxID=69332 RepID=A0A388M517_CHABU|nr:hypothetical protein CBR_g49358 [Chara braunii]|eukprot:GBG89569.1 hypothetical protein CBR_g49358 [Chara braunii]